MENFKKEMNLEISVEREKIEERLRELKVTKLLVLDKDEQKRKKRCTIYDNLSNRWRGEIILVFLQSVWS